MDLNWRPVRECGGLLAPEVYEALCASSFCEACEGAEIDPAFADGESLHREYGVPYETEMNCIIAEGTRGEEKRYAALLIPYGMRANMNGALKRAMDVKKVSMADKGLAVGMSGMEFGSITPVGLPEEWIILADPRVTRQEYIILGGGRVNAKVRIPSALLRELPGYGELEGLAKE